MTSIFEALIMFAIAAWVLVLPVLGLLWVVGVL